MTPVLTELSALPEGLLLDGELVAWKGSEPYFPLVCRRVLNRGQSPSRSSSSTCCEPTGKT